MSTTEKVGLTCATVALGVVTFFALPALIRTAARESRAAASTEAEPPLTFEELRAADRWARAIRTLDEIHEESASEIIRMAGRIKGELGRSGVEVDMLPVLEDLQRIRRAPIRGGRRFAMPLATYALLRQNGETHDAAIEAVLGFEENLYEIQNSHGAVERAAH